MNIFFINNLQNAESSEFAVPKSLFFLFVFLRSPCKSQKAPGLQHDDLFFFFLEINRFFLDRRCEKAASQSLSCSIFAKTSGHFRAWRLHTAL